MPGGWLGRPAISTSRLSAARAGGPTTSRAAAKAMNAERTRRAGVWVVMNLLPGRGCNPFVLELSRCPLPVTLPFDGDIEGARIRAVEGDARRRAAESFEDRGAIAHLYEGVID